MGRMGRDQTIRTARAYWTDILYARMKLSRVAKSGVMVAVVGVVVFIGTAVWLKSVRTTVADIAILSTDCYKRENIVFAGGQTGSIAPHARKIYPHGSR